MNPRLPDPRRRAASSGAVLALGAALAVCMSPAWSKTSDRNQRTNVSADSQDCSLENSGPCIFSGDVRINQGTLDISASRADVRRAANGEIASVKLTASPVRLKQQNDDGGWVNATASQIDYDLSANTVVLTGNAKIDQPGRGSISGARIIYNMRTSQVQSGAAAGGGGGRVNMTFEPKHNPPAGAPAKGPSKAAPPADDAPAQGTPGQAAPPRGRPVQDTPAEGTDEQN